MAKVVLATAEDWPAKSRWFHEANVNQFEANDEIRAKVRELVAGLKSDEERIAAINHWVAQEIRYCGLNMGEGEGYTLHPGAMIWEERSGVCKDIAGMAITMLRAAGYEVHPAMTMAGARVEFPALNRSVLTDVEGRFRFDAVPLEPAVKRLRIAAKGKEFWVDAAPGQGDVPTALIHLEALEV